MCGICLAQTTFHPECPLDGERQEITAAEISEGYAGNLPTMTWDEAAEQITRWDDKWDDENGANGNAIGTPGTVTYGYLQDPGGAEYLALTPTELANVEIAIANFEEIANLDFIRVSDANSAYVSNASDIEMDIQAQANTNGGWMSGSHYAGTFHSATVTIGETDLEQVGSWAFKTALHEIGHAIGMPHPGDYNGSTGNGKSYYEDSAQYTVMSYFAETDTGAEYGNGWYRENGEWIRGAWQPNGLMLHDIAAVQRLYGKNMETRTGDSVYGWNSNLDHEVWSVSDWKDNMIAAIWDAGGIDTIDGSGYTTDSVIDLREEAFSSLGAYEYGNSRMINNVAIARDVKIENAVGGSGDDTLIGNMADAAHSDSGGNGYNGNNILDGGAGNDTVSYAGSNVAGVDTLRSIENLIGSTANDRLLTSRDGGTLSGEAGDDLLIGRSGADSLTGGEGNDWLQGNSGNDTLVGGQGSDWLRGGHGADHLSGGEGFDWADYFRSTLGVVVDLLSETAQGGFANGDTFDSIERIRGSAFDDTLTGDEGANIIRGNDGGDTLNGGSGNDVLYGEGGGDVLNGGDGSDWSNYVRSNESVEVNLLTGASVGGEAEGDSLISIERLFGSSHDDIFVGDDVRNYLRGGDGADNLSAQGGTDTLRGDQGDDTLTGGEGRDTFIFAAADGIDTITDFEQGIDKVRILNSVDTFGDLTVTDTQAGVRIEFDDTQVILADTQSSDLIEADFLFA